MRGVYEEKISMKERACLLFVNNDTILLMYRRKHGVTYYVVPGGSIEPGETLEDACIREAKEETNLDIQIGAEIWEHENQGRKEHYVLVEKYTGHLQIGGPEALCQSEENTYTLEWIPVRNLCRIPLQPAQTQKKLCEYFSSRADGTQLPGMGEHIECKEDI
jgi:ADP-ribose pyrophosphatase YjhB (NUDIX family)